MNWLSSLRNSSISRLSNCRLSFKGNNALAEKTAEAEPSNCRPASAGNAEVIQFAEYANRQKEARNKNHILIIGKEHGFSEALVDYALGMADRMDCNIAALNVVHVCEGLLVFLDGNLKEKLKKKADAQVEKIKMKAEEKNIRVSHSLKFGDSEKILREVHEEFPNIAFVMTEPEDPRETGASVPVFCLAGI